MGTVQSTHATSTKDIVAGSVSGLKNMKESLPVPNKENFVLIATKTEPIQQEDNADSTDYDSDYDSDDEDEEWNERIAILNDARNLKRLAGFFLNPEKPVHVDPVLTGRCYFDRASAPVLDEEEEEAEEQRDMIMEDLNALKKFAADYLCPEKTVVVSDPFACGRNYFTRPSAPTSEDFEDEEERALILEEMSQMKELATDYMCPEKPVITSDPFACARNYFNRPSAPTAEEEEERAQVLKEMSQMKKLATDYLCPEKPVVTSDPYACGRNYFARSSAPINDDVDEEERALIFAEMSQMKRLAVDYFCPEKPVVTSDPFACGRNYFTRPSAPVNEDLEDEEERALILEEMSEMKKLATDYLCPEKPVAASDPFACGRNYFTRPSAPTSEEEEERVLILEEMLLMKKLATDYLCPEKPMVTSDPFACGRNYFTRPSAPLSEEEEERAQILKEMQQMKKLATDYLCPEKPVVTSDPYACGHNFFTRPSAPTSEEDEDERAQILKEMAQMKKLATDYLCPEKPVVTSDPFACGRNYFTRPLAPTSEEEEERAQILKEMSQMKTLATDYMYPERPVVTSDPFACGRNYFTRPSALLSEEEEERAQILKEMNQMKKLATDYLCPEKPVVTSDPYACGRNYFARPSAPVSEEEEEHNQILKEMAQMKKLATDYMCPEKPIVTSDPFTCGRNYFTRPSAPINNDLEEEEEHNQILKEMAQMKKLATDYLCPEKPIVMSDPFACGRNYFTRPSAPINDDLEEGEERAQILREMQQMKKLATDYLCPEKPVVTSDPFACGRSYFTRPSAPVSEEEEERNQILKEMAQMKKLATDYLCPEKPVETTDPFACGRNFFTRPSAPTNEGSDDEEERVLILKEMRQMKKLATDYLHPERPVEITNPFVCGRNYFTRPSAPGEHIEQTHTYCEYVDRGFHHVIDHDHHYYWYSCNEHYSAVIKDNIHDQSHPIESAAFGMDEDQDESSVMYEFNESTLEVEPFKGAHPADFSLKGESSATVSRSPVSVLMLTWEGALSA